MKKLCLVMLASVSLAGSANAATIFAVDENNNLVTFDSANPGTFIQVAPITGTTATFLGLDFRDSNGLLYGLGDNLSLYTINQLTGMASLVGGPLAITGTNFGFDFNTVVDAIRVVSNDGSNYVVNADAGTATRFTDVAYASGDVNAGRDPVVTGNAYIHGTANQFAIDTNTDFLVMQANNAGTLTSVGALGVAVGPRTSFDIDFDRNAYVADASRFYTVNTTTGVATFVGNTQRAVFGIAAAPVPEPSTWAMLLLGFGAVGFAMRRNRRVRTVVSYA